MPANTPIDPNISAATLAYYKQMWALWQANRHMSAAWLSLNEQTNAQGTQNEWVAYKRTTGQTPSMFCVNPTQIWNSGNVPPVNAWGVGQYNAPPNLAFYKRIMAKGASIQWCGAAGGPPSFPAPGTTYSGAATTIAALNTQAFIPVTATTNFSASGGIGQIVASDGLHPFTYTGFVAGQLNMVAGGTIASPAASNQNGNVNMSSAATVAVGAGVFPSGLNPTQTANPPNGPGGTVYANQAWPLHWSSSAYLTLTAALPGGGGMSGANVTAAGWADAQSVNSNGNLNAQLDQMVAVCAALAPYPVIIRLIPESNNTGGSAFWYSEGLIGWGAQLFRYMAGYIVGDNTGAVGFSGQPVSATPVHNVLFAVNSAVGGGGVIGTDYPTSTTAPWTSHVADFIGLDVYSATWGATAPQASFTTAYGVSGYTNVPPLLMEAYANSSVHYDPWDWMQGGTTGDLSTLGGTSLVGGNGYNSARAFINGTVPSPQPLQVLTTTGVRTVTYNATVTTTGVNPSKIPTIGSLNVAGVPPGSQIATFGAFMNPFVNGIIVGTSGATPNAGNAAFLSGIKNATAGLGCHFCVNPLNYGGAGQTNSQLFQPGFVSVMCDPGTVNLPTPGGASWSAFGWGQGEGTEWGGWQVQMVGT